MLNNIRIVLVETSHPGNIGAVARAMKNMGLAHLVLVNPKQFPHEQANARASGATELLEKAQVVATLSEAIADCSMVYASSARQRALPWPMTTPRKMASEIMQQKDSQPVAIVFGRESTGLSNEELALCQVHCHIPTNPNYSSLNIAAAVQIIAYELYQYAKTFDIKAWQQHDDRYATQAEIERFYEHLQQVLVSLEFAKASTEKSLMQRLRRLFSRTRLERLEVNILRGILTAIEQKMTNK